MRDFKFYLTVAVAFVIAAVVFPALPVGAHAQPPCSAPSVPGSSPHSTPQSQPHSVPASAPQSTPHSVPQSTPHSAPQSAPASAPCNPCPPLLPHSLPQSIAHAALSIPHLVFGRFHGAPPSNPTTPLKASVASIPSSIYNAVHCGLDRLRNHLPHSAPRSLPVSVPRPLIPRPVLPQLPQLPQLPPHGAAKTKPALTVPRPVVVPGNRTTPQFAPPVMPRPIVKPTMPDQSSASSQPSTQCDVCP